MRLCTLQEFHSPTGENLWLQSVLSTDLGFALDASQFFEYHSCFEVWCELSTL